MSDECPAPGSLVDREQGHVVTQYREAWRFRAYLGEVIGQIEEAALATCAIPSYFDIRTAIGDQLTLIGKRMGFPRCHCVCDPSPVFGFKCAGSTASYPTAGFCEPGIWAGCGGVGSLCIEDDAVYRAHLLARRYQMLGLFDLPSLEQAIRTVWGSTAWVPRARAGQVVVSPGRTLTNLELRQLQITLRILPVAPGIRLAYYLGAKRIFGFGTGWQGFCPIPAAEWLCTTDFDSSVCT